MSESLHPFQIGDIVYAIDNDEYRFTHPNKCFFGMVSDLYPYNHEDNIQLFTIHYIQNDHGILTPQTLDSKNLNPYPHGFKPLLETPLKPYQKDIVLSMSTSDFSRYDVNSSFFERVPDIMDLEFQRYYYEYVAGEYFPDHDFESFQRNFLKPFVDLHNQFKNSPRPLIPLSLDKSL